MLLVSTWGFLLNLVRELLSKHVYTELALKRFHVMRNANTYRREIEGRVLATRMGKQKRR